VSDNSEIPVNLERLKSILKETVLPWKTADRENETVWRKFQKFCCFFWFFIESPFTFEYYCLYIFL